MIIVLSHNFFVICVEVKYPKTKISDPDRPWYRVRATLWLDSHPSWCLF